MNAILFASPKKPMAHLWHIQDKQWQPREIRAGSLTPASAPAVRLRAGAGEVWVLLAAPAARVRVNGLPLPLGIRSLRDHDEIVFGQTRLYFSNERVASVESFPSADHAVMCPRCRKEIERESPAVRCPGCSAFYHQLEGRHCWTYSPKCQHCDTETALDAGFRWQPET